MISKKIILAVSLCLILVLSTGCINMSVYQKLKRNGHYDLDMTISTSLEYKMILNALKERLEVEESVRDRFSYSETDTSIIYSFKDIDPETDRMLLKEVENNDTQQENILGQSQDTPSMPLMDPGSIDIKKEFKFPYYEYTYTMRIQPEPEEEKEVLLQNTYILDEANIISDQSESEIIQSINEIYMNDSVEVIVITKSQMAQADYFTYKYNFASNFPFKNKDEHYVMIFVSTNPNGLCRIESNIYQDPKVSSKITALNTDFGKNCRTDYDTQITNAVGELESFFKTTDVELTSQIDNQLADLFKVGYTVEVFGKITETNGLKNGENKVEFVMNPSKEGEYRIVFRDFFLATIFGDSYPVYLIVFATVIIGIATVITLSKRKSGFESKPPEAPLAVNPQLMDYIRKARAAGVSDEQIKSNLLQNGWNQKDIDTAIRLR